MACRSHARFVDSAVVPASTAPQRSASPRMMSASTPAAIVACAAALLAVGVLVMSPPSLFLRLASHWVAYYAAIFEALGLYRPQLKLWRRALSPRLRGIMLRLGLFDKLFSTVSSLGAMLVTGVVYFAGVLADVGMGSAALESAFVVGLVLVFSAWLQCDWIVSIAQYLFPYVVFAAVEHEEESHLVGEESGKPLVALSIDDVPCTFEKFGASNIDACLRLLEEHDARATLFVMSQEVTKHDKEARVSDTLVGAVKRGHELGNHDLLDVKTVRRSSQDFSAALQECDEAIEGIMSRAGQRWRGWRDFEALLGGSAARSETQGLLSAGRSTLPTTRVIGAASDCGIELCPAAEGGSAEVASSAGGGSSGSGDAAERLAAHSTEVDVLTGGLNNKGFCDPLELAVRGERIKWFRPGGGFFKPEMIRIAARHGYSTVLGNCFPVDTHMPLDHNVWYLRRRCGPGKIIIIHDRPKLLPTLKKVLPDLCSKYKVVTLSALFEAAAKAKQRRDQ